MITERKKEFQEAYAHGKLVIEDNFFYYRLGYKYKGKLYVKIHEHKKSRPELYTFDDSKWYNYIGALKKAS